jgi:hypothetical protein
MVTGTPSASGRCSHALHQMGKLQYIHLHSSHFCTSGTLGFSFSGAGHLAPYILGALHTLVTLHIINSTTPLAGASAGSFVAVAFHASDSTVPQLLGNFTNLVEAAGRRSTDPRHPTNASEAAAINAQISKALNQTFTDPGGYLRVRGKSYVALTRYPELTTELVTNFSSNDEMEAALRGLR